MMVVRKLLLSFVATTLFCFLFAGYAGAQGGAMTIKKFEGEVFVKSSGSDDWKAVTQANMALMSGDSIRTKKGTAEVEYSDGSILKLKNNSTITLSESKDQDTGRMARRVKVTVGKLWAKITPGTTTDTQFETPSAIAAVKGTVVDITVEQDPVSGLYTASLMTEEGMMLIHVTNCEGVSNIDLGGGQSVSLSVDPHTGTATLTVLAGDVTVRTSTGATQVVPPNNTIKIDSNGNTTGVTAPPAQPTETGPTGVESNTGKDIVPTRSNQGTITDNSPHNP